MWANLGGDDILNSAVHRIAEVRRCNFNIITEVQLAASQEQHRAMVVLCALALILPVAVRTHTMQAAAAAKAPQV